VVRNCVSGCWSKWIVTPVKKWFCRCVRLEVLTDNSVRTTDARYPSLCTHSCGKADAVTGDTNRKAAEKLYKNHSHRGQRYQLDFYNCCLQLEQGLMLRQEVVKRTISKWQLRKLQRSGEHMQCTASWVSEIIVNQFISACITIMLNFDWSAVSTLIGSMLAVVHHLYSHENSGSFDGFSDSDTGADVDKVYCRNIRQPLHMK